MSKIIFKVFYSKLSKLLLSLWLDTYFIFIYIIPFIMSHSFAYLSYLNMPSVQWLSKRSCLVKARLCYYNNKFSIMLTLFSCKIAYYLVFVQKKNATFLPGYFLLILNTALRFNYKNILEHKFVSVDWYLKMVIIAHCHKAWFADNDTFVLSLQESSEGRAIFKHQVSLRATWRLVERCVRLTLQGNRRQANKNLNCVCNMSHSILEYRNCIKMF